MAQAQIELPMKQAPPGSIPAGPPCHGQLWA